MKLLTRIGIALAALVFILAPTACSDTTIAKLTQTLGNAAASVATLEGNTALAAKLTTDTTAAVTAITNWKSGTPAAMAIEALNLVEDDLALIPGTSQFAPLIDLAIGTVESILALLPPSATAAVAAHTAALTKARPHILLSLPPKNEKQFKAQWNGIVAANPKLAQAKL